MNGQKNGCHGTIECRNGILTVDCNGCPDGFLDDPAQCLMCLVGSVYSNPRFEYLVIRDGEDRMLPDGSVDIVRTLSRSLEWLDTAWKASGTCVFCKVSPRSVRELAWSDIPSRSLREARESLSSHNPREKHCLECIRGTMRSIERAEYVLSQLEGTE